MSANDESSEFERRFGKSQPEAEPQQPGEFTRNFFGAELSDNTSVAASGDQQRNTANIKTDTTQTGPLAEQTQHSPPGEFTRNFGGLSTGSQSADSSDVVNQQEGVSLPNLAPQDLVTPSLSESNGSALQSHIDNDIHEEAAPSKRQEPGAFTRLFQLQEVSGVEARAIGEDSTSTTGRGPRQIPEFPAGKHVQAEASHRSLSDILDTPPTLASEPAQLAAFALPSQSILPQPETIAQEPHKLSGFTQLLGSALPQQTVPGPQGPGAFTRMVQKDQLPAAEQLQDADLAQGLVAANEAHSAPAFGGSIPLQSAARFPPNQRPVTDATSLQSGPSEFTRVISASSMRAISAEQNSAAPAAPTSAPPPPAQQASYLQSGIQPASWPAPSMTPPAYPPIPQVPPTAIPAWPPSPQAQPPSLAGPPLVPQPPPQPAPHYVPAGKWAAYMPLILALNGLLLLAILIIVIFALSRK